MTQYLILPNETVAIARSHDGLMADTAGKRGIAHADAHAAITAPGNITQYLWGWLVGNDGKAAVVIDGDEHLLTPGEQSQLVDDLPDDEEGDNWYRPPPEMP